MELENILSGLVRVGTVSAVNAKKRQARILFQDTGHISGWLFVLQHNAAGVDVAPDGLHTHKITDTFTGGGAASEKPNHNHKGTHVTYWMPKVNDQVVALFLPIFNADGFILGAI